MPDEAAAESSPSPDPPHALSASMPVTTTAALLPYLIFDLLIISSPSERLRRQ
ncbi:hypothetical protein SNL152K_10544 [Streptomyces sp. NL15-2K]|nr:hypothetical protein SNL152K_10544 [Streptomyces sp. NL15-2K]